MSFGGLFWLWPWNLIGIGFAILVFITWRTRTWSKWTYEVVVSPRWIASGNRIIDWEEVTDFKMDRSGVYPSTVIHYKRQGVPSELRIDSRISDYPVFVQQCAQRYSERWASEAMAARESAK